MNKDEESSGAKAIGCAVLHTLDAKMKILACSPCEQLIWCLHCRDKDESGLNHTHPHRRATGGGSGTGSFDALAKR